MRQSHTKKRFEVEQLESRQLLAGNITASLVNSTDGKDLLLQGDNLSNAVQLQYAGPGKIQVIGIGTTINGRSSQLFTGIKDDVRVNMNGGHDVVKVFGGSMDNRIAPDDLLITMGSGNDTVSLQGFHCDDISVDTGSGVDTTYTRWVHAQDDLSVFDNSYTAGSYDVVKLNYTFSGTDSIWGTLKIDLNNGPDKVYMYHVNADTFEVKLYGGNDYLSMVYTHRASGGGSFVNGGTGTDTLNLYQNAIGSNWNSNVDPTRYWFETVTRNKLSPT